MRFFWSGKIPALFVLTGWLVLTGCDAADTFTDNIKDTADTVGEELSNAGESVANEVENQGKKLGNAGEAFVNEFTKDGGGSPPRPKGDR